MSKYDVDKVRKKMHEKQGNRFKDPNEFRPPQATSETEALKYRFFILPPLAKGDKCSDGAASQGMDLFYVQNGAHWINNRYHSCPRVHDEQECPLCQLGFDMMAETDDKARRSEIARQWLPRTQYAVNVYFPKDKVNPDEVAGRVMWMNLSKQVYDLLEACIMNDGPGDEQDPQAFGVFFDESAAYLFQLQIKKKNKWNDYSTSKFLAGMGKMPVGKTPERLEEILSLRHDLFTKFSARDADALASIRKQVESGEPEDKSSGFDEDETKPANKPVAKSEAKPAKSEAAAPAVEDTLDEAEAPKPASKPAAKPDPKPTPKAEVADDVASDELQGLLNELEEPV